MTEKNLQNSDGQKGMRLAKYMAHAGVCSRREAEKLIAQGAVTVDGATITTPACVVQPSQAITVNGRPISLKTATRLWRYHKPAGLVTTERDPDGRPTVFANLPPHLPRVVSVGRLDLTTEGLLLLTNDGELKRFLELPVNAWQRHYRVRVHGAVNEQRLANLAKGITIEGVRYGPIIAKLDRVQGSNAWLEITLREGKNREIRKVMEHMRLQVTRLIRVSFGSFQLGTLESNYVEEVPKRVLEKELTDYFKEKAS